MDPFGAESGLESDVDDDNNVKLKVNRKFASKFEAQAKYDDLQRIKSIERQDDDESDDSDASSEDDMANGMTPALDLQILKTINSIRRKDPAIYETDKKWFDKKGDDDDDYDDDDDDDDDNDSDDDNDKKKVRYKDVVRRQLMEDSSGAGAGAAAPSAGAGGEKSGRFAYDGEQEAIRKAFLAAAKAGQGAGGEDDGSGGDASDSGDGGGGGEDILAVKKGGPSAEEKAVDGEIAQELHAMQAYSAAEKAELEVKRDQFLSAYISNKKWLDVEESASDDSDGGDGGAGEDFDDDAQEEAATQFESAYNFRFEEMAAGGGGQVVGHARNTGDSLRRTDEKRKAARESRKEKKEREKRQREEELKRLKNLKRKELEARLDAVSSMGGTHGIKIDASMLDEDWDPDKFDAQMAAQFDDSYYDEQEGDEEGAFRAEHFEEVDGEAYYDEEGEGGGDGGGGGWGEDDGWDDGGQGQDDAMDMNDVDAEEVERRAQLVEDELYKLNYEDVVGGIKTRFKYVDRIVQYSPLSTTVH